MSRYVPWDCYMEARASEVRGDLGEQPLKLD